MLEPSDVINQRDLTDIYRPFHHNTKEYIFLSTPHETFPQTGHTFRRKASVNRYKRTGITPCDLSEHRGLKLDTNNNRNNKNPERHRNPAAHYGMKNGSREKVKLSRIV